MNKLQLSFLNQCQSFRRFLNDWERGFLDNLSKNYTQKELSFNQNKTLNAIHKKIQAYVPTKVVKGPDPAYQKQEDTTNTDPPDFDPCDIPF